MDALLTTGIEGFLGRRIRDVLGQRFRLVNVPRDTRASAPAVRAFVAEHRPAAIIHLAGLINVRHCQEHPLDAFRAHVMDTANLLEAVRTVSPATPVVYVATDKSFGEQERCTLSTPFQTSYVYETSKACEDMLVGTYRKTYGLSLYLLRFPNFFGEGDSHVERLIPSICLAAARGRKLTIRTRLDGTSRQYMYVGDAADAVERTLTACLEGRPVWPNNHFGPPYIKTVGEVLRDVADVAGRSLDVEVLDQPGEVGRLSLSDENFLSYAYTDWKVALERTYRWYAQSGSA
jgi:nucleoside-diphosphate-sugar epimerase